MKDVIKRVPIPIAGVALGLAALGILLQPLSEVIHLVAGLVSLVALLALMAKTLFYPDMIVEDLKNPILAAVSATVFMTLMQLATYLAPFAFDLAFSFWLAALLGHASFIVWFTVKFTIHHDLKQVFPTHFIAYVGIVVAALTSPVFGMAKLGEVVFWFGFVCYLVLFVVVSLRYMKHEVPMSAKPLFCIYTAPMSLSLAGYLSVTEQPNVIMVTLLAVLAQALLVFVLAQMPKLLKLDFYPSYAAMTFPFVVSATALLKTVTFFEGLGFSGPIATGAHVLIAIETLWASAIVLYVVGRYVYFLTHQAKPISTQSSRASSPSSYGTIH